MNRTVAAGHVALVMSAGALAAGCASTRSHDRASAHAREQTQDPNRAERAAAHKTFVDVRDRFQREYFEHDPLVPSYLGLHEFDGKLPDPTPGHRKTWRRSLREYQQALGQIDTKLLGATEQLEQQVLAWRIGLARFELEQLDVDRKDPARPLWAVNPVVLLEPYAPVASRRQAFLELAGATPAYLDATRAQLDRAIPAPLLSFAAKVARGTAEFYRNEAKTEMTDDAAPPRLGIVVEDAAVALERYANDLEQRQASATDAFALGAETFAGLLEANEGFSVPLSTLRELGERDLKRNHEGLVAAARKIDPNAEVGAVVRQVQDDKPTDVLAHARAQLQELRAFIDKHDVVTVPAAGTIEVRPSPSFHRWNGASLYSPGPFEKRELPSYYHVTLPDPTWSASKQRDYLPGKLDLLWTSVHEVWPGHFLHHLYLGAPGSDTLRVFWHATTIEGWAHYSEQMMFELGAGGGTPQAEIGYRLNALLRNIRLLCAIGLHTGEMTLAQAQAKFETYGYTGEGHAEQQALRGVYDPTYYRYSLGKWMMLKLRDDYLAAHPDAKLKDFHDRFMAFGWAPIPLIRQQMLGESSGPPL